MAVCSGEELEDAMPAVSPGRYLMARLRGGDVAAVSSPAEGAPAQAVWNSHVWVDDAGSSGSRRVCAGAGRMMAMKVWGLSKSKANYRPAPAADTRCDRCRYMFPPFALGGCRLVRGVIRGSATCNEFLPRKRA